MGTVTGLHQKCSLANRCSPFHIWRAPDGPLGTCLCGGTRC